MKNRKTVNYTLSQENISWLHDYAGRTDKPMSKIVTRAIEEYRKKHDPEYEANLRLDKK
jgi:hypothetical protein